MKQKREKDYPRKLGQENDAALPTVMSRVEADREEGRVDQVHLQVLLKMIGPTI